jgi:hypothetical protein
LKVDTQQGKFKILQLLLQILILSLVEIWNPPTRLEFHKLLKETVGILEVNPYDSRGVFYQNGLKTTPTINEAN